MTPTTDKILDFLRDVYRFQPVGQLSETICRRLPELISGDNAIVCGHDGARRIITSVTARHPFSRANMMPHINESGIMATHPLWEGVFDTRQPVRALSDITSPRDWQRQTLYQEVFRPDGIEDQLNTEIWGDHQTFITVNVLRGKPGFSSGDREVFLMLRPHLIQAFQNALLAERAGLTHPAKERCWTIPVDCHGRILPEGEPTLRFVASLISHRGRFPEEIERWVSEQVRRLNEGWLEAHLTQLAFTTRGQTWIITFYRNIAGGRYTLCIKADDQADPPTRLSPREAEIMHWVAEGKTNDDIAIILGMSLNTVKTHLKRAFAKLGVENRTAAAQTWQTNQPAPPQA